MSITKTADGIYKLSTNINGMLFEEVWEMPNGVALNSYIVKGEKTAIIDGVCGWDGVPENLFKLFDEMNLLVESIDYVIINHMEPDHSGWIEDLKKIRPDIKVVCSFAAKKLLEAFYGPMENILVVRDGDSLDLGGRILKFVMIPNVHWPDTMVTYDDATKTLFTCDAFGSFGEVDPKRGYDDLLTKAEEIYFEREELRYYSNIIANYSPFVIKAINKLCKLDCKIIAPGHGIVWRKNPKKIIEDYLRYANYQSGKAKRKITLVWGSMYGMTETAVKYIRAKLKTKDLEVEVLNVVRSSIGTILASVWESSGIILAMPTYENKMYPPMAASIDELLRKKVDNRVCFRLGSFGWSGGAEIELKELMDKYNANWSFVESVEFKGSPKPEDLQLLDQRLEEFIQLINKKLD